MNIQREMKAEIRGVDFSKATGTIPLHRVPNKAHAKGLKVAHDVDKITVPGETVLRWQMLQKASGGKLNLSIEDLANGTSCLRLSDQVSGTRASHVHNNRDAIEPEFILMIAQLHAKLPEEKL